MGYGKTLQDISRCEQDEADVNKYEWKGADIKTERCREDEVNIKMKRSEWYEIDFKKDWYD